MSVQLSPLSCSDVNATFGATVSTTKAVLVKPVPGLLPVASCQVPAVALAEPLLWVAGWP